jgi:hypothetical protein
MIHNCDSYIHKWVNSSLVGVSVCVSGATLKLLNDCVCVSGATLKLLSGCVCVSGATLKLLSGCVCVSAATLKLFSDCVCVSAATLKLLSDCVCVSGATLKLLSYFVTSFSIVFYVTDLQNTCWVADLIYTNTFAKVYPEDLGHVALYVWAQLPTRPIPWPTVLQYELLIYFLIL